jgi:hypothetical protein
VQCDSSGSADARSSRITALKRLIIFGKGVSEVTKTRDVVRWMSKVTAEPSSKATQRICSHCIFHTATSRSKSVAFSFKYTSKR